MFLDRDGTLLEDTGYLRDPNRVCLLPGVPAALRQLQQAHLLLVLVSNQSGIGRSLISPEESAAVHARFLECLSDQGVQLHACYDCPHAPEEQCSCRKPSPSLLLRAAREWGIVLHDSVIVGDKVTDVEAGQRAGCAGVLLCRGAATAGGVRPDFQATGWSADCPLDSSADGGESSPEQSLSWLTAAPAAT